MEELRGKIKEIKKVGEPKDGIYSYVVKMEDGKEGWHREKSDPPKWCVGDERAYIFETKTKADGKGTYNTMSNPKSDYKPGGGGSNFKPKTVHQIKMESRTMILRYAVDIFIAGKIEVKEVPTTFGELCVLYDKSLDAIPASE